MVTWSNKPYDGHVLLDSKSDQFWATGTVLDHMVSAHGVHSSCAYHSFLEWCLGVSPRHR